MIGGPFLRPADGFDVGSSNVGDRLTFLGHSTVLVDLDGVRVLTDPLLGHMAAGVIPRQVPAVAPDTLLNLSAVFISHGHWDHLDLASLRAIPGRPVFIVPVGLGRIVAKTAPGAVHELRIGHRLKIGGLTLEAIHAERVDPDADLSETAGACHGPGDGAGLAPGYSSRAELMTKKRSVVTTSIAPKPARRKADSRS